MNNHDTTAAHHYHNGTKHPGGALMRPDHAYDPRNRPYLFKDYEDPHPIPLPLDKEPGQTPALTAISTTIPPGAEQAPTAETLARLLYFSAGITKRITRPWSGEILFRAAPCTGALYHIELYLVCGDVEGLAAGVYHYDPKGDELNQLREGDFRPVLVEASGREPAVAHAPAVLVYTDVPWRNAVKYQAREYRHAFWDSGVILAHTLALAAAHNLPARLVMGFVDEMVNDLLGLDEDKESSLALLPVGRTAGSPDAGLPDLPPPFLEMKPVWEIEKRFPAIGDIHKDSSLTSASEAAEWRVAAQAQEKAAVDGRLFPLEPFDKEQIPADPLETVILRRGSTRQFNHRPITFRELSTVLHYAMQPVPADFLLQQPPGGWGSLNSAYLIVNAVEGLPSGSYLFQHGRQALVQLKAGDFRGDAGLLALGQALGSDAAVNIYFLTDLETNLARFGNRGYRAAQMEAAITAGRVYLAAYAQHFGATGLTFYDDAVTEFFSPQAQGLSVMFLVTLGHKAKRG